MLTEHRQKLSAEFAELSKILLDLINNQQIDDRQILQSMKTNYSMHLKAVIDDFEAMSEYLKSEYYRLFENSFTLPSKRKAFEKQLYD